MARSHEPPNGSDHPVQNGVKARRAAIVLFIVATFGIVAVLAFPLTRNIRLPLRLPRPLQSALSPAERLIRPIVPWLGPLPGSPAPREPGQVVAGARPPTQPPPARGAPSPLPPPSEGPPPPPPPPGGDDVQKERTTRPGSTVGGTVGRPPPRGSGTASGTAGGSTGARGQSDEHAAKKAGKHAKHRKHAKNKKHAKQRKKAKQAKRAKHGAGTTQGNGGRKG